MALTAPKLAYTNIETKNFLSMIYVFGVSCMLCKSENIEELTIEHFNCKTGLKTNGTKDVDFGNIYPCCAKHNLKKGTKSADLFFETFNLLAEKTAIIDGLRETETVTDSQREIATKLYVDTFVKFADCFLNSLSDANIRFLLRNEVKSILGNYDLTNCFIVANDDNIRNLAKHYIVDYAKIKRV